MLLQQKRIFIVEDNVQNRVIYQMMLTKHGAVIEFDRWGREALRRLEDMPHVDLIVLDLMLTAEISGYDIFDEIRALPQFDHVPIVAVSAAEASTAMRETQARGFSGFIAKPVDKDLFPKQLAQLMNGEPVWYMGNVVGGM